jgi:hypothetical protein
MSSATVLDVTFPVNRGLSECRLRDHRRRTDPDNSIAGDGHSGPRQSGPLAVIPFF